MTEAIFGLVGVVLGGVLTGGVEWFFRVRDGKRARRHAARLLLDEVDWFAIAYKAVRDTGDVRELVDREPLFATWERHRDALADIPYDDWFAIVLALRNASTDYGQQITALQAWRGPLPLTDSQKESAREAFAPPVERLGKASTILARYAR